MFYSCQDLCSVYFSCQECIFWWRSILSLSWKLKCIKLKQYHFVPVGCNCICLSQITFLSDMLFFLFCLKCHLIWSGKTLHFITREYLVSTSKYCVLTCGTQWLILGFFCCCFFFIYFFFGHGFLYLTSEKSNGTTWKNMSSVAYKWLVWMLGVPKCFYLMTENGRQEFTLVVTCRVNILLVFGKERFRGEVWCLVILVDFCCIYGNGDM